MMTMNDVTTTGELTPDAPQPADYPGLVITIPAAAQLLSVSRSTIYALISDRLLETVHIGRSVRIPTASLEQFIETLRTPTAS